MMHEITSLMLDRERQGRPTQSKHVIVICLVEQAESYVKGFLPRSYSVWLH